MYSDFDESFQTLFAALPPIVARHKVPALTGGVVASGTLANHDSKGTGPENAMMVNGKMCYPRESLVVWLKARARVAQKVSSSCTSATRITSGGSNEL